MLPVEVTIQLGDVELAALDRHIGDSHGVRTREQVVAEIIAEWAANQAHTPAEVDEGLKPDELNASNDI